jgi:hypothetical protein
MPFTVLPMRVSPDYGRWLLPGGQNFLNLKRLYHFPAPSQGEKSLFRAGNGCRQRNIGA